MAATLPCPDLSESAWVVHVAPREVGIAVLPVPPSRVILVDPIPAGDTQCLAGDGEGGAIRLVGALGRIGEAALYRCYNQPALNGFAEPTGAKVLYPGLRERQRVGVQVLTAASLRDQLPEQVAGEAPDMLLIEIPGEGKFLIEWLAEQDLLDRFGTIWMRGAEDALCAGDAGAEDIMEWLEDLGFAVRSYPGREDPDLLWITARRRPPSAELALLRGEAEALQRGHQADRNRIQELEQAYEKLQTQFQRVRFDMCQTEELLELAQKEATHLRREVEAQRLQHSPCDAEGMHLANETLDLVREEIATLRSRLKKENCLRMARDIDLDHLRGLYRSLLTREIGVYETSKQIASGSSST